MEPEDRVLVGVIKRKKDLKHALEHKWYRIPQAQMSHGVHAEYLALFLSGSVFKEQSGGIHYFSQIAGLELAYRRDLLPDEPHHRNANNVYYRVALKEISPKMPPVLNPTKRIISFIYTTWDRFIFAQQISDLFSKDDYYVDRIYHALRNSGIHAQHIWEAEKKDLTFAPGLRILCENGTIDASTSSHHGSLFLDSAQPEDKIFKKLLDEIRRRGGPVAISIPTEG